MKLITAVIRPATLEAIKEALAVFGVRGLTVGQSLWADPDVNHVQIYRGRQIVTNLDPRLRMELLVPDEEVADLVRVIARVAFTAEIGDPLLWISQVDQVIRVRTGERGLDAL
ncbi:MAG TPA: P-II family nitrogen regulator [Pseudonocardiaceae bacterium]|nr:P-II family nitrogen regulator [Pseudonocardiaceae bacterium]